MERTTHDVDAFLGGLDESVRDDLTRIDAVLADVMRGQPRELYTGRFWGGSDQEIIGYGRYDYERSDGTAVEWFVLGLAAQERYLSLYVSAVEDGAYLTEKLGPTLGRVKVGKSAITFARADVLDFDALRVLAERARDAEPPR